MSSLQLYFLMKLDAFGGLLIGLSVFSGFFVAGSLIAWAIGLSENSDMPKRFCKAHIKFSIPLFVIFLLSSIIIPSTKQAAALTVVPKICNSVQNNSEIMSLPNNIASLASEWINELRPEKIKEAQKQLITNAKSIEDSTSGK